MKKLYLAQIALLSIALCTINLEARTLQESTNKLLNDLNANFNPFQMMKNIKLSEKDKQKMTQELLNMKKQGIITNVVIADLANLDMIDPTVPNAIYHGKHLEQKNLVKDIPSVQSGDLQDIGMSAALNNAINHLDPSSRSTYSIVPQTSTYNPKLSATNKIQALKDENDALKNEIESLKQKQKTE